MIGSELKSNDTRPCTHPKAWPVQGDPVPPVARTSIPGGFQEQDCSAWAPGPDNSGYQYRACLYHRSDNPRHWNAGAQIQSNINGVATATLNVDISTVTRDGTFRSLGQSVVTAVTGSSTEIIDVPAPYRRWPSDEAHTCILARVTPLVTGSTFSLQEALSPYRTQNDTPCVASD